MTLHDWAVTALITLAAGALAVAGILAYRIIWPAREPRQEPVSPAATATPGRLRLLLVRWAQRRAEPGHVGATTPDDPDEPAEPVEHEGATEGWSPAAAVAEADAQRSDAPTPDWDVQRWLRESNAADHAALNDLEDRCHHDVEHLWNGWYDQLGVDAKTRLRLPSSVERTGELDRAELDARLEGVS